MKNTSYIIKEPKPDGFGSSPNVRFPEANAWEDKTCYLVLLKIFDTLRCRAIRLTTQVFEKAEHFAIVNTFITQSDTHLAQHFVVFFLLCFRQI